MGPARADLVLQPNDTLAICGDSITEQKIYSVDMEDYILMCHPVSGIRIVQFGWSGEQASGFAMRIGTDVLPFKPTVATTCYGMNDGHYVAMAPTTGDAYRTYQTQAADELKQGGLRLLVGGSPGCVDTYYYQHRATTPEVYNATLTALGAISKEVVAKEGGVFADVNTAMNEAMKKAKAGDGEKFIFSGADGVHPQGAGHLVMAGTFLKALGFDGAIGTITVDLAANMATGTPGQKVLSCANGAVELESTVYPFCFSGDPAAPPGMTTLSVLKYYPFNDELNRYVLVVTGLKGAGAKVTWGASTKTFTKEQLEKGVNLAAEFLQNPFADAFTKVDAAVHEQQALETTLVKGFMHNLGDFKKTLPDQGANIDQLVQAALAKDKALFDAAQAAVVPVKHTITIVANP